MFSNDTSFSILIVPYLYSVFIETMAKKIAYNNIKCMPHHYNIL